LFIKELYAALLTVISNKNEMKKIIFLFFIICFNNIVQAETAQNQPPPKAIVKLSGKVINSKTEDPLISATVYIPDLKKGAVTDVNGHYEIKHIPKGKYLVEVRYTGFSTTTESILINKDT